jgi:hypothetical protein
MGSWSVALMPAIPGRSTVTHLISPILTLRP